MSGWGVFLLIALVLGIVLSNLMLLKHSANMKLPESVRRAIAEKKIKEKTQRQKKPSKE